MTAPTSESSGNAVVTQAETGTVASVWRAIGKLAGGPALRKAGLQGRLRAGPSHGSLCAQSQSQSQDQ